MITCNESGSIVVKIDNTVYDFSNSEQYADFLLWATSPDKEETIGADAFKLEDGIPEEHHEKASRYAEFLIEYARRRQDKLDKITTLTTEQRENDVHEFIARLQSK